MSGYIFDFVADLTGGPLDGETINYYRRPPEVIRYAYWPTPEATVTEDLADTEKPIPGKTAKYGVMGVRREGATVYLSYGYQGDDDR